MAADFFLVVALDVCFGGGTLMILPAAKSADCGRKFAEKASQKIIEQNQDKNDSHTKSGKDTGVCANGRGSFLTGINPRDTA